MKSRRARKGVCQPFWRTGWEVPCRVSHRNISSPEFRHANHLVDPARSSRPFAPFFRSGSPRAPGKNWLFSGRKKRMRLFLTGKTSIDSARWHSQTGSIVPGARSAHRFLSQDGCGKLGNLAVLDANGAQFCVLAATPGAWPRTGAACADRQDTAVNPLRSERVRRELKSDKLTRATFIEWRLDSTGAATLLRCRRAEPRRLPSPATQPSLAPHKLATHAVTNSTAFPPFGFTIGIKPRYESTFNGTWPIFARYPPKNGREMVSNAGRPFGGTATSAQSRFRPFTIRDTSADANCSLGLESIEVTERTRANAPLRR